MTTQNFGLPQFTIRQLLEAGAHFGHKTMRRNPKMSKYIYGAKNGLSIIDLGQTANLLHNALKTAKEVAKNNGRILFVSTKKQAFDAVSESAKRCGQYYVNDRWLGGMLTNWKTVSASIKTLRKIEDQLSNDELGLNKKERLVLERKLGKLEMALGGIKNMGGYPDLVFIIDTNRENLAVAEAKKLGVPIMAILDSNSNPDGILYPIPGNDDSIKAIKLYCRLLSDAVLAGIKENMALSGVDVSKLENISDIEAITKKDVKNDVRRDNNRDNKAKDFAKKPFKKEVVEAKEEVTEPENKAEEKSDNTKVAAKKAPAKKPAPSKKPTPAKKPAPKKK